LIFVLAVLAVLASLRCGAGINRDSIVFLRAERVVVYVIGIIASYWLIERGLTIFPSSAWPRYN